jgi:hypothetical protein
VTLPQYIAYLNRWVYFWPGDWQGPTGRAKGISTATGEAEVAILRAPTLALFNLNQARVPCFACVNSGAARHHSGLPAKRDLNMHRRSGIFRERVTDVVEVVFEDEAWLPADTEVALSLGGPWRDL